jgi:hypothetical protein
MLMHRAVFLPSNVVSASVHPPFYALPTSLCATIVHARVYKITTRALYNGVRVHADNNVYYTQKNETFWFFIHFGFLKKTTFFI